MSAFTVTIKDVTAWTTRVRAKDAIHAEDLAWDLFQSSSNRSDCFNEDSDTTVQVEEVAS